MSLVARHLEVHGITTVVIGSARDIVEMVGVPRFVFIDYPLGNPLGKPDAVDEQRGTVAAALELAAAAPGPRTTRQLDLAWGSDGWRTNYMHVGPDNAEALAELGRQRREKQARKKG